MTPSPIVTSDLEAFTDIVEVRLSGDGRAAVATSRPDLTSNGYDRQIVVVDIVTGEQVPSGFGAGARSPRWSPVGPTLAAVLPADEGSKVAVLGENGATPTVLCTSPDAIEELVWSPDGKWLLFVVREPLDREYWRTPVERRPPLRLTTLRYQEDNLGFVVGRPRQAFLVAASGGEPTRLSVGGFDDAEFSWHPDSRSVVFVSQRHANRDRTLHNDVFVQSLTSGEPVALTGTEFCFGQPVVSPDGATIAFTAMDVDNFPANVEVGTVRAGGGTPSIVTGALDRDCFDVEWRGDDTLGAVVHDRGAIHHYELSLTGAPPRVLLGGERRIDCVSTAGDTFVYVTSSPTQPPRLVAGDDRSERVLYAPNAATLALRAAQPPVHRRVPTAPDVQVDSWLTLPDPSLFTAPYPTIVCLQGGGTQYGWLWSHEFQLLNAAGYATLCLNARGSAGYGQAWSRTVCGPASGGSGWGTVDIDDVAAVVSATLASTPQLDADRVGVQGGSYGALVTTWLLARTDLFRAGWAERGPYNVYSLAGSNDESPWFFDTYLGVSQLGDAAAYWAPSPLRVAPDITAPLAIVHSELDRRCPIQQAEELFMALKIAGQDAEFIRFPGESHELTRSGSPVHRLQRLELLLEWFGRHLAG